MGNDIYLRTAAVSLIVAVCAIAPALWGIYQRVDQLRLAEEEHLAMTKLNALGLARGLAVEDQEMQVLVEGLSSAFQGKPDLRAGLAEAGSGEAMAKALEGFLPVMEHYDQLGAMVRMDYLPFDLCFATIDFPEAFWKGSENFRRFVKEHWRGEGQAELDLWREMEFLREAYAEEWVRIASERGKAASSE
ncbi:MAG: hypothetical protein AAF555_04685 [Verrucomicrobiota bacterium]